MDDPDGTVVRKRGASFRRWWPRRNRNGARAVHQLFIGLALRFARSIVQPTQQLTEPGRLACTFRVMQDVRRHRVREHDREQRLSAR